METVLAIYKQCLCSGKADLLEACIVELKDVHSHNTKFINALNRFLESKQYIGPDDLLMRLSKSKVARGLAPSNVSGTALQH
jgi:hypothetical protein